MPVIDLRGIKVGEYKNTDGVVTYETPISIGEAMAAQLDLTMPRAVWQSISNTPPAEPRAWV